MTNKIAFVFPGQGSQEVGMGYALHEASAAARAVFEQANDLLGFSLSEMCFNGPEDALNDTINTQIAIFVTSLAALHALREAGYEQQPDYLAGHSLGEYTAYVAGGVLSFEDGVKLVRERGRLMKQAGERNPGSMAAILKLDDATVEQICADVTAEGIGTLQVANYNSPGQVIISGDDAAVERGIELAQAAKARRAVKLPVSVAAHSALMGVIEDEFTQAINKTVLNLPETPIIANITVEPLTSLDAIRAEMMGQLTGPVRWTDTVRWMMDHEVETFIEIGPKNVLTGLIRRVSKAVTTVSVATPVDVQAVVEMSH